MGTVSTAPMPLRPVRRARRRFPDPTPLGPRPVPNKLKSDREATQLPSAQMNRSGSNRLP